MSHATKSNLSAPASPSWKPAGKARRQFGVVNPPTPSMGRALLIPQNSMEKSFVVLRPLESNVYPRSHHALHSPQSKEHKNGTPFLTLALLKLAQVLPGFLDNLATPTVSSVAKACALMESMATPRSAGPLLQRKESPAPTTPSQRYLNEPRSPLFQPLQLVQQLIAGASPASSRSPSPFSSPSESPSSSVSTPSSPSALALEKEWERLVAAPFWLLAAAEILTADCCRDPSLIGLYQRCTQDLFRLQHLLCEPVLAAESSQGDVVVAAQKVHALLDAVLVFAAAQSEFIQVQSCLHQSTDTVAQAATGMGIVLARLDAIEDLSLSLLFQRAYQQVQGWKYALEACLAVEQCLFLESIVLMRQWQHALPKLDEASETCQTLWLERCFRKVLAALPLFLDSTRVCASSLYGLVNTKFPVGDGYDDLESDILDFLRRQDRLSGPPTAIAVILDAEGTSNFHPEKGFCLGSNLVPGEKSGEKNSVDLQTLWPPVFIRSTLHSASTSTPVSHSTPVSSPHSLLTGRKTQEGQKAATTALEYIQEEMGSAVLWPHSEWETLAELLEHREDDDFDVNRTRHATPAKCSTEIVDENIAEEDREKQSLRCEDALPVVLARKEEGGSKVSPRDSSTYFSKTPLSETSYGKPVTYRDTTLYGGGLIEEPDFIVAERQPSFFHLRQNASVIGTKGTKDPSSRSDLDFPSVNALPLEDYVSSDKALSTTSFHLVSLSRWTTLVVMVKKDEEVDTNRRRTKHQQLSDGEIHHFLNELADQLRVCLFWSQCLPESQLPTDKQTKEPILSFQRWARSIPTMSQLDFNSADNPKQQLYDPWMSDGRVSLFLDQVKVALGLRSATLPSFQSMNRSSSWWWGPSSSINKKSPRINQRRKKKSRKCSHQDTDVLAEGAASLFLGPLLSQALTKDE